MPLSVDQFRNAATTLGDDANIKLRNDNSGVATGKWQRFKVWVADQFSSNEQVASRQQKVVTGFIKSIRATYGDQMANIASDQLYRDLQGGPLTGRAIHQTLATLENHGGQHWLHNERLTREFAHSVYPASVRDQPSLSSVVNPLAETLINEAVKQGLTRDKASEFLQRYTTDSTQAGVGFDMPDVSHAIETALKDAARNRGENGELLPGYRRLDPDEARQIATHAAKKAILNAINLELGGNFIANNRFEQAFDKMCELRGLGAYRHLMDVPLVRETFNFAMQAADGVVSKEQLPKTLDAVLTRYFDRQQEKLDAIAEQKLDNGPAKQRLIDKSLGVRSRMDQAYFDEAAKLGAQFGKMADDLKNEDNPARREELALQFGQAILDAAQRLHIEGGDDIARFLDQAFSMFAAKADPNAVNAASRWADGDAGRALTDAMVEHMMNPEDETRQQIGGLMTRTLQIMSNVGAELGSH